MLISLFSFNGKQFSLPVIIANINAEAVLGLDFMQKFSCSLNAKDCTLTMDDIMINCFMRGKTGCYRSGLAYTEVSKTHSPL